MLSYLPSIIALGLAALIALGLTLNRRSPPQKEAQRLATAHILALTTGIQSVHFAEEAFTGFPERLGALLGLPAMPMSFFLIFNLTWIVIWIASVWGLQATRAFAFFATWFLAIAGMVNGIAHPLLAIAAGGYFPGLVTSPIIGVAGIFLWRRLRAAT